jgi:hypothetical protein
MSDTPPDFAALLQTADPEVLAAMRAQLGMAAPPEATIRGAVDRGLDAALPSMAVQGEHVLDFDTPTTTGRVVLRVDGVEYECVTSPPSTILEEVLAAYTRGANKFEQMSILSTFPPRVMVPEAKARYMARCEGAVDEGGVTLQPIDIVAKIKHASRLLEVYTGRPLGPASGSGGTAQPTAPTSTGGA